MQTIWTDLHSTEDYILHAFLPFHFIDNLVPDLENEYLFQIDSS